ncbi:DUF4892 domain-containing protein [Endozoicomonas sp. Mp262]|uniref:DUF4892 domain-containing protein n=1 Tax=Endozoicomonas sp. Mp262 TaxID=2919499 RepID=UPI0021D8A312
MKTIYLVTGLILLSRFAGGDSGHDSLAELANAKLVESVSEERQQHPLIFSAMKKVNGLIKADSEQWLDGELSRKLYLLPDGLTSFSAFDHFTRQFEALGAKPVYQCQRFHCGDSNFWANNVFKLPVLYGLDREQSYYIGERSIKGQSVYYSVYTVRRGNRRSYALVDIFKPAPEDGKSINALGVETLYSQMLHQGYAYLPVKDNEHFINDINTILSNHNSLRLIISIFSPKPDSIQSFDQTKKNAESHTKELTKLLVTKGIDETRFRLIYSGIQPDLPNGENQAKLIPIFNN